MKKYIDADKLKAEIERRYAEYRAKMKTDDFTYYEGMADALDLFEQYIDSLQQEQPKIEEDWVEKRKQECGCRRLSADGSYQCERYEGSFGPCDGRCSWIVDYPKLKELEEQEQPEVDLEKAALNFAEEIGVPVSDTFLSIARHFYERGQKNAANKFDEIEYNLQRAEEEMLGKTLDEAAEKYVREGQLLPEAFLVIPTFKAGAKWMAGQGAQFIGRIKVNGMGQPYLPPEYIYLSGLKLKEGDRVIVQIRKKEESK